MRCAIVSSLVLTCTLAAGSPRAQVVTLHAFGGTDGARPYAGLTLGPDGALYGTTNWGGEAGIGAVIRVTIDASVPPDPVSQVIYSFRDTPDGSYPAAGVVFGPDGALYGTTGGGGVAQGVGYGTVFRLSPPGAGQTGWTESILYGFRGGIDGLYPMARLAVDATGNLYGTTRSGGPYDQGIVFRLRPPHNPHGVWAEEVLHAFGGIDGTAPDSPLTLGPDGALYGVTPYGGARNLGVAFTLKPPAGARTRWAFETLHTFQGKNPSDGASPVGGLTRGSDGNLYGYAASGGLHGLGCIYALIAPQGGTKAWHETVLYNLPAKAFTPGGQHAAPAFTPAGNIVLPVTNGASGTDLTLLELTPVAGQVRWANTLRFTFSTSALGGSGSYDALTLGVDNALYGTVAPYDSSGFGLGGLFRVGGLP